MKVQLWGAAALAMLVAVPASAQMHGDSAAYVARAGAADLYEIQSSQLAAQRTRNPQLRSFARMLVMDHMRSTRQLTAAARASGLRPAPPHLSPEQAGMIRELRGARGPDFDRAYLGQQVQAHQQALSLHQDYASGGDRPALRRAAAGIVPVVQHHLDAAQRMER